SRPATSGTSRASRPRHTCCWRCSAPPRPSGGSAAERPDLAPEVLAERLLLAIYAYGTNTGIRSVAAGPHGHTEDDIRYARRRYLTLETARAIAIEIANATFACRQQTIWGASSTEVASDSTHMGAFDENIFTEWHSRYGGRGVLIYWHVETGSVVVHSQLLNARRRRWRPWSRGSSATVPPCRWRAT